MLFRWLLTGDYFGGEGDVRLGCGLRHDDNLTVRSVDSCDAMKLHPGYLYSSIDVTWNCLQHTHSYPRHELQVIYVHRYATCGVRVTYHAPETRT